LPKGSGPTTLKHPSRIPGILSYFRFGCIYDIFRDPEPDPACQWLWSRQSAADSSFVTGPATVVPLERLYTGKRIMPLDNKKLAVIHIVKNELGLSDREYRDRLEEITGVRSAKFLDEQGFRRLMNYFARSKYYRRSPESLTFRQRMYIKGLQGQLLWSEPHFENFLKKYYKKSGINTLTRKEGAKVIESLKNILEHERLKKGSEE